MDEPVSTHELTRLLQEAQQLLRVGATSQAFELALRLERVMLVTAVHLDALGTLLTRLEEPRRALHHFERAVEIEDGNVAYRYNLAMAQRMVGDLPTAERNLDIVLQARPLDGEAHLARSGLRRQTVDHNHVGVLHDVLRSLTGRRAWIPAAFALAKELEDLADYPSAFAQLDAACRTYRASLRYEVGGDIAVLDRLRTRHTGTELDRVKSSSANQECIFIVGLPRSGTTLVDRIVGSHSDVYSAGELAAFAGVTIASVSALVQRPVSKLEFVDLALKLDFDRLGSDYLVATRPRTGQTRKFTDKRPLNCLYAGLIHAALPQARFIALRREPMDSCFALYKTLFAAEYPFSYDLEELAQYYAAWQRLMQHWEMTLGASWLTVQYEDLVSSPECVSRRMLAHCGLDWQPRCLEFHSQAAAVTTASTVQVRRAVNRESVGKWQRYAHELAPLQHALTKRGVVLSHTAASPARAEHVGSPP